MRPGISELPTPDGVIDGRDRVELATFGTRRATVAYVVTINAAQGTTAWLQQGLSMTITAAASALVLSSAQQALSRILTFAASASVQTTAARALKLALTVAVTASTVVTLVKGRGIAKTITVSASSAVALGRKAARQMVINAQQGTTATLKALRHLYRLINAAQGSSVAFSRSIRRTITVAATSLATVNRHFAWLITAQTATLCWLSAPGLVALFADPFLTIRLFLLSLFTLRPKMLTAANLLPILDTVGSSVRFADALATSTQLTGVGAEIYGNGTTVYGTGNEQFILKMAQAADAMVAASQPQVIHKAIYNQFFTQLASFLSSQGNASGGGYSNLDSFLTSLNSPAKGGAPYAALVSPNTAYLQWLYNGNLLTLMMQPANVYAPSETLGTAVVAAGAALTFTATAGIPTVNDPPNAVQGFTPSMGVNAVITTTIAGTLTVTLTANGWNAQGVPVTGRTWTAQLNNKAAEQTVAFVPTAAGDRISLVTALAGAGSAGGGAFSLQSIAERSAN